MEQRGALGMRIYHQRLKENDYNFYLPVVNSILRTQCPGKSLLEVIVSIQQEADIHSTDVDRWERTYLYLNQNVLPYPDPPVSLERSEAPIEPYPEPIQLNNDNPIYAADSSIKLPPASTDSWAAIDWPQVSPSPPLIELRRPPWFIPADLPSRPTTQYLPDQWAQPFVKAPLLQPLPSTYWPTAAPQTLSLCGSEGVRQARIWTSGPEGRDGRPFQVLRPKPVQPDHPSTLHSKSQRAPAPAKIKKQCKQRRNRMPKPVSMDNPFAETQTPETLRRTMFPKSAPYISGPGTGRNNFRKRIKAVTPLLQSSQSLGDIHPQAPASMLASNLAVDKAPLPEAVDQSAHRSDSASTPATILERQEHGPISFSPCWQLSGNCSYQKTNSISSPSVVTGSLPPTLPPSVEEAYKKKCIELKRRLQEVEETNDTFRLRKVRLMRGIRKMRLERAFLLETLGKRMKKNGSGINGMQGIYDEDSEGSSEGPPTPHEKPLRSKRSHRRPVPSPPPHLSHQTSIPNAPPHPHSAQGYHTAFHPNQEPTFSAVPTTNGTPTTHIQPRPNPSFVHTNSQSPQAARGPRLLIPFDDFVETAFLDRPQEFPDCHSQDDLIALATRHWQGMNESEREPWKARYEQRQAQYYEVVAELARRGSRERVRNVDSGETRDVEMEEQSGSASGAGFTAVNG